MARRVSWESRLQDHMCGEIYDISGCELPAHLAREMLPRKQEHRNVK